MCSRPEVLSWSGFTVRACRRDAISTDLMIAQTALQAVVLSMSCILDV